MLLQKPHPKLLNQATTSIHIICGSSAASTRCTHTHAHTHPHTELSTLNVNALHWWTLSMLTSFKKQCHCTNEYASGARWGWPVGMGQEVSRGGATGMYTASLKRPDWTEKEYIHHNRTPTVSHTHTSSNKHTPSTLSCPTLPVVASWSSFTHLLCFGWCLKTDAM